MKALTILQPWASLIACGAKKIETRSWATKYRGPLAIHAGKREFKGGFLTFEYHDDYPLRNEETLPMGAIIAIADLVDCLKVAGRVSLKIGDEKRVAAVLENDMKIMGNEFQFGDYTPGRYAWILANVRRIEPVPAKGRQRLWNWEAGNAL